MSSKKSSNKQSREFNYFIRKDLNEYSGKWIAIKGERVIAHKKDIGNLIKFVNGKRIESNVVFAKVPSKNRILLL